MPRVAVVTVFVLLFSTTPAQAEHRMTFEFASWVAADYWAERDVVAPCHPTAYLMTDAEDAQVQAEGTDPVDMLSDSQTCEVDITPIADWYRIQPDSAWIYCQEIVHEFGHLAGLEHDYGGVMDFAENVVPFGCAHPRQWTVLKGWRQPPRWVHHSPMNVQRLWLAGHGYAAQTARAHWLRAERHKHHTKTL